MAPAKTTLVNVVQVGGPVSVDNIHVYQIFDTIIL